ncbi:hypothetical protein HYH03_012746 [Edaphochlamys debaryana]|uniref:Uncharacterized protein n=1 Tax=Edaphochlamys debaryana TaxID=47281 RepID=A0A835XR70_9CHLO|nr:hypothetical protein HYH03_012746 [Edaphochlamys debaryana]|eukprot:KAG2488748.1 hypothetical protein HYH03_012746 [Edaphochlamys debaryana]
MIALAIIINAALVCETCIMMSPLNDEDREYIARDLPSPFASASANVFADNDGFSTSTSVPLTVQAEACLLACSMVDNPLWAEDASADDAACCDDIFEDMPLPSTYDCKLAVALLLNCPAAAFSTARTGYYDRACCLAGVFNTDTADDIHDCDFDNHCWKPTIAKATTCDDILSGNVNDMLDTLGPVPDFPAKAKATTCDDILSGNVDDMLAAFGPIPDFPAFAKATTSDDIVFGNVKDMLDAFGPVPDFPAPAASPALLCTPAPSVSSACGSPFTSFTNSCASPKRSLFGSPADSSCLDNPLFDSEDEDEDETCCLL